MAGGGGGEVAGRWREAAHEPHGGTTPSRPPRRDAALPPPRSPHFPPVRHTSRRTRAPVRAPAHPSAARAASAAGATSRVAVALPRPRRATRSRRERRWPSCARRWPSCTACASRHACHTQRTTRSASRAAHHTQRTTRTACPTQLAANLTVGVCARSQLHAKMSRAAAEEAATQFDSDEEGGDSDYMDGGHAEDFEELTSQEKEERAVRRAAMGEFIWQQEQQQALAERKQSREAEEQQRLARAEVRAKEEQAALHTLHTLHTLHALHVRYIRYRCAPRRSRRRSGRQSAWRCSIKRTSCAPPSHVLHTPDALQCQSDELCAAVRILAPPPRPPLGKGRSPPRPPDASWPAFLTFSSRTSRPAAWPPWRVPPLTRASPDRSPRPRTQGRAASRRGAASRPILRSRARARLPCTAARCTGRSMGSAGHA